MVDVGGTLTYLELVLYVPFLRDLFHFSTLLPDDLGLCLGSSIVSVGWFEATKWFHRTRGGVDQAQPSMEAPEGEERA